MEWQPGTRLNQYEIKRVLGRGGFGITYKATHLSLGQRVVIKTINDTLQKDPEYNSYLKRFRKEARTLAKLGELRHPHIVRVSDLFEVPLDRMQLPCLVMDFIDGEDLFTRIRNAKAPLSEAEALKYIQQVGDALHLVHRAGLVHRDTHPGNIMICNNNAILIDFGLAGSVIPTIMSSKVGGNPAFVPHDQLRGNRDPNVDIYSLGMSLYFALIADLPDPFTEPKATNPNVSDRTNAAIVKAIHLNPKERPQSIKDWFDLLGLNISSQALQPLQNHKASNIRSTRRAFLQSLKKRSLLLKLTGSQYKALAWGGLILGIGLLARLLQEPILEWKANQQLKDQLAKLEQFKIQQDWSACIIQAEIFPSGKDELFTQAKELLGDCILELAQEQAEAEKWDEALLTLSRMPPEIEGTNKADSLREQWKKQWEDILKFAQQEADSGNYKDAITQAKKLPTNVDVTQEAHLLIEKWENKVLEIASNYYYMGNLAVAKETIEAIPEDSSLQTEIEKLTKEWEVEWSQNQVLLRDAQSFLEKGDWYSAREAAGKVTTIYWKKQVEPIIEKAQLEIDILEIPKTDILEIPKPFSSPVSIPSSTVDLNPNPQDSETIEIEDEEQEIRALF